jgi:hypothetical protein
MRMAVVVAGLVDTHSRQVPMLAVLAHPAQ